VKKESLLVRARALVTPGEKIEYSTVESRIRGSISGWGPHTVFHLENGQQWQVANYDQFDYGDSVKSPKVTIHKASLGGFVMEIEGLGSVRVRPLGEGAK
jgi:hypothetical protein